MKGALNRVIIISVTLDTAYSGGVNCGWEKGGGGERELLRFSYVVDYKMKTTIPNIDHLLTTVLSIGVDIPPKYFCRG